MRTPACLRELDARARVLPYLDQKWLATQTLLPIGAAILLPVLAGHHQLAYLVENKRREHTGSCIAAITQFMRIRTGVMVALHFICGYQQTPLD